jgi:hypothetical protein
MSKNEAMKHELMKHKVLVDALKNLIDELGLSDVTEVELKVKGGTETTNVIVGNNDMESDSMITGAYNTPDDTRLKLDSSGPIDECDCEDCKQRCECPECTHDKEEECKDCKCCGDENTSSPSMCGCDECLCDKDNCVDCGCCEHEKVYDLMNNIDVVELCNRNGLTAYELDEVLSQSTPHGRLKELGWYVKNTVTDRNNKLERLMEEAHLDGVNVEAGHVYLTGSSLPIKFDVSMLDTRTYVCVDDEAKQAYLGKKSNAEQLPVVPQFNKIYLDSVLGQYTELSREQAGIVISAFHTKLRSLILSTSSLLNIRLLDQIVQPGWDTPAIATLETGLKKQFEAALDIRLKEIRTSIDIDNVTTSDIELQLRKEGIVAPTKQVVVTDIGFSTNSSMVDADGNTYSISEEATKQGRSH